MKQGLKFLFAFAVVAVPLQAQSADISVPAAKQLWQMFSGYVAQSAEDMPEAKYGYKPVATVRSFGELIGHVAGAQNMLCAAALGEPAPAEDAVEKAATSKAALVAAIKASNAYCAKAYAQSDASARTAADVFGQKSNRLYALLMNASHDAEHYGNIITYLRMNGMVPPSSRGQ